MNPQDFPNIWIVVAVKRGTLGFWPIANKQEYFFSRDAARAFARTLALPAGLRKKIIKYTPEL